MSNIEDDIKAKGFIEGYKQIKNNAIFIKSIDKDFFFELVDFLLEEREQDKARIKELEEENKRKDMFLQIAKEVVENSIPKQKVKDKIEELDRKEQELQNSITEEEREEYSDANISFQLCDIEIRREVLQELLQEREDQ